MSRPNKSQSIRQKLLNLSTQRKIDYNIILIWYALERLLYRLSRSKYSDKYVLKGAMLFSVWSKQTFRATKDIDFLGYGDSSGEYLKAVFTEIITTAVEEDGIDYIADSLEVQPIREEQEYGGQRIHLMAKLGNARIRLQIDIGFGDTVTPAPQRIQYPTLLDMSAPEILVYSKETVVAEKFHALTLLGLTNSRMKDYYDLWILAQQDEFDGKLLSQAIKETFNRRQTAVPQHLPLALTKECYEDEIILTRWNAFMEKTDLSLVEKNMEKVVLRLQVFFGEIIESFAHHQEFEKWWNKVEWKERHGQKST